MPTEEQLQQDANWNFGDGTTHWSGQRLFIVTRKVTKLGFWINKEGAPTGDVVFAIQRVSDNGVISSKVWGDAATLTGVATYEEVEFDTPLTINEEVRIYAQFLTGSAGNNLEMALKDADVKAGEVYSNRGSGAWSDKPTRDCAYIYTYEPALVPPTVTIQTMTDRLPFTAKAHGNVTDLGNPNPTEHGHCWNKTGTPTTADPKTELGPKDSTGAFESTLLVLEPLTTYFVRAYVTNSEGTSYSAEISFTTSTEILRPDAVGDVCAGLEIGAGCPNHYQNVNEVNPDENTSTVYGTSSPGYEVDLYNLPAHSIGKGTIERIKVYARFKRGATVSPRVSADILMKTGGTIYDSSGAIPWPGTNPWIDGQITVTEDWADYSTTWATNPNTGNPWTWADIDGLQIGIAFRKAEVTASGEPRTSCTQVWLEVLYKLPMVAGLNPALMEVLG